MSSSFLRWVLDRCTCQTLAHGWLQLFSMVCSPVKEVQPEVCGILMNWTLWASISHCRKYFQVYPISSLGALFFSYWLGRSLTGEVLLSLEIQETFTGWISRWGWHGINILRVGYSWNAHDLLVLLMLSSVWSVAGWRAPYMVPLGSMVWEKEDINRSIISGLYSCVVTWGQRSFWMSTLLDKPLDRCLQYAWCWCHARWPCTACWWLCESILHSEKWTAK